MNDLQRIVREYFEILNSSKLEKEEVNKFLEIYD
jgi:hypothetical protein